jgi:rhodanese-related sulfurtransferase
MGAAPIGGFMKSLLLSSLVMMGVNAFAAAPNCDSENTYPEISKVELQQAIDKKSVFVVDANGTTSYKKAHVPTAIDFKAVKSTFAKELPADKSTPIVAYCGGPACDAWKSAAVEACKLGYTNVKHFKAGIKGWMAKN